MDNPHLTYEERKLLKKIAYNLLGEALKRTHTYTKYVSRYLNSQTKSPIRMGSVQIMILSPSRITITSCCIGPFINPSINISVGSRTLDVK